MTLNLSWLHQSFRAEEKYVIRTALLLQNRQTPLVYIGVGYKRLGFGCNALEEARSPHPRGIKVCSFRRPCRAVSGKLAICLVAFRKHGNSGSPSNTDPMKKSTQLELGLFICTHAVAGIMCGGRGFNKFE